MKFHITSGKNGFQGGTAFRTDNKVTLKVWEKDWPSAELALLAILDTFAKKGHKIIYRKNGKWERLSPAKKKAYLRRIN